jgi:hypothetical protein
MVRCPECRAEVQADWDWCHACGWDPEGLRPSAAPPEGGSTRPPPPPRTSPAPAQDPAMSRTTLVVVGAVAAVAVVIVAVAAVGFLGSSDPVAAPPSTSATSVSSTAPTTTAPPTTPSTEPAVWVPWAAPGGTFTVELPVEPTYEEPAVGGLVDREERILADTPTGRYEVWVYHFSPTADSFFELGANSRFSQSTEDILRLKDRVRDLRDVAGTEGVVTTGFVTRDGSQRNASFLVTTRNRRSYVLIAIDGPAGPADPERLFASFSFT